MTKQPLKIIISTAILLMSLSSALAEKVCPGDDMTYMECVTTCIQTIGGLNTRPPSPHADWESFCRETCRSGLNLIDAGGNNITFNIKRCTNIKRLKDTFCRTCNGSPCNGSWNTNNADYCRYPCEMCRLFEGLFVRRCKNKTTARLDDILTAPSSVEACIPEESLQTPAY